MCRSRFGRKKIGRIGGMVRMSEKRFIVFPYNVVWDNQLDEVVCRCILEGIGDAENVCQRLNEQQSTIQSLKEENAQLREKVKDYEVILSIANSNDVLCEYQEIDDIAYYCERYKDYRCYPLCRKDKSCFKKDKTFQGKLEDLKEFWGERWYE